MPTGKPRPGADAAGRRGGSVFVGGVPPALKRRFKALCDRAGTSMQERIKEHMRRDVEAAARGEGGGADR